MYNWTFIHRQDSLLALEETLDRQCNEKRVSCSLVTVTELTANGVVMTTQRQTLSSVCDFTCSFWIEVSHNMFLYVRDLENMVM